MKRKLLLLVLITFGFQFIANAQCDYPSASAELNIGNIRAKILNGGDLYYDGTTSTFEVPNENQGSMYPLANLIFGGGIWMSALDNNDLNVAGMTYRQNTNYDFFPGPIDNLTGLIDYATCTFYDQIWEVLDSEIQNHVVLANSGLPIPLTQIANNILNWPAKGNAYITAVTINQDLAPFEDVNANGIYDPENGDYPKVYGDESFFWVMNDIGGFHGNTGGEKLGVEIQCLAYAYDSSDPIMENTIIYDYKIINKSFGNLTNFNFGLFTDLSLGNSSNDFVGCDTLSNTAFGYNSTLIDQLYGYNTPIVNSTFLNQPMTSFVYIQSNNGFPSNEVHYDNYLKGRWNDGLPFVYGGNGRTSGGAPTNFLYPGNPAESSEWSECSAGISPGDRRFLQSSGLNNFNAWTTFEIAWAVHVTFPTDSSTVCFDYDTLVRPNVDSIQNFFDNKENTYDYEVVTGLKEATILDSKVSIYPNPTQDVLQISFEDLSLTQIKLISINGKVVQTNSTPTNNVEMDLSNLSSGIYLLEISAKEGRLVKKIVKE